MENNYNTLKITLLTVELPFGVIQWIFIPHHKCKPFSKHSRILRAKKNNNWKEREENGPVKMCLHMGNRFEYVNRWIHIISSVQH